MRSGRGMTEALTASISEIDGVFTYMIGQPDQIGYAKDRFAMKPLAVIDQFGQIAAATEEQALRCIIPETQTPVINLDGPSLRGIWGVGNKRQAA
jgi:glutamine phosphoribosylpyrophosphate amidotransferase